MSYPLMTGLSCGVHEPYNCYRATDKNLLQPDRNLIDSWWWENINLNGILVNYYIHQYNIDHADNLYGEQPLKPFYGPIQIILGATLQDQTAVLQTYGFVSEDELKGFIHITSFRQLCEPLGVHALNKQRIEPKSGDLIELIELGNDRPSPRTGKVFEITNRLDELVNEGINALQGHYVWFITAKRYEHSWEVNAPREGGNTQVYENDVNGLMADDPNKLSADNKPYIDNIDNISKDQVFDQTNDNNDDIYGGYGY